MSQLIEALALAWHPHHIEHLAPFCDLLQCPMAILSVDAWHALSDYPGIVALDRRDDKTAAEFLCHDPKARDDLSSVNLVLYSHLFSRKRLTDIFSFRGSRPPRVLYCPHGYSEKQQRWSSRAASQDISLFYSSLGLRQLHHWGVRRDLSDHLVVGNYRHIYLAKHRNFYDTHPMVSQLREARKRGLIVIVYAPSWDDAISTCSISRMLPILANSPLAGCALFIKPHPLSSFNHLQEIEDLSTQRPNIHLLRSSLTLPLLEQTDVLIGDMSALAYDFLRYGRPMIFINGASGAATDQSKSMLFECGVIFDAVKHRTIDNVLAEALKAQHRLLPKQRSLDRSIYGATICPDDLTKRLEHLALAKPSQWLFTTHSTVQP